jgi:hypothetical protein
VRVTQATLDAERGSERCAMMRRRRERGELIRGGGTAVNCDGEPMLLTASEKRKGR